VSQPNQGEQHDNRSNNCDYSGGLRRDWHDYAGRGRQAEKPAPCLIANDGAYARLASPISRERVLVGPAKESGVSASATANDLWFGPVRFFLKLRSA
jgi:hypothetical protein